MVWTLHSRSTWKTGAFRGRTSLAETGNSGWTSEDSGLSFLLSVALMRMYLVHCHFFPTTNAPPRNQELKPIFSPLSFRHLFYPQDVMVTRSVPTAKVSVIHGQLWPWNIKWRVSRWNNLQLLNLGFVILIVIFYCVINFLECITYIKLYHRYA